MTTIQTLGDLLLACMQHPNLFQALDNFYPTSPDDLKDLLKNFGVSSLSDERLSQLFNNLRNFGTHAWMHELRLWCIAHPTPMEFIRGGTDLKPNWTPG